MLTKCLLKKNSKFPLFMKTVESFNKTSTVRHKMPISDYYKMSISDYEKEDNREPLCL